jgi:two-component system response regulator FlrC
MSKRHPILLVEDDATLREALAETMRIAGHEVVTAADGETALVALTADVFDAVVTDYQMKPMDGFALLSAIRELRPSLPVLMITAHGSIEHAVRCMLEGATDYLVKPFAAPVLIERLKRLRPLLNHSAHDLVVADPLSVELVGLAERVAVSDATVLISGESGYRQGGTGPAAAPAGSAPRSPVCRDQLCGDSGEHAGGTAVRPRKRRLHRRP